MHYYIGCYWSSRKINEDEAVLVIINVLQLIMHEADSQHMIYKGISRKLEKAEVIIDPDSIKKNIRRNRRDSDKSIIEELGYSYSCWNGDSKKTISISCSLGIHCDNLSNSVLIEFMEGYEITSNTIIYFEKILNRLIEITKPDIALFSSSEINNALNIKKPIDQVGYIKYIKRNILNKSAQHSREVDGFACHGFCCRFARQNPRQSKPATYADVMQER